MKYVVTIGNYTTIINLSRLPKWQQTNYPCGSHVLILPFSVRKSPPKYSILWFALYTRENHIRWCDKNNGNWYMAPSLSNVSDCGFRVFGKIQIHNPFECNEISRLWFLLLFELIWKIGFCCNVNEELMYRKPGHTHDAIVKPKRNHQILCVFMHCFLWFRLVTTKVVRL